MSGATYDKGMMRAPVMHFSYFQVITLVSVSMPTLTFTMANKNDKYNNIGGPGVGRFGADFEFGPGSWIEGRWVTLEAKLTFPDLSSARAVGVINPPPIQTCLPTSYAHNAINMRFFRNGNQVMPKALEHKALTQIPEAAYPRFESEFNYWGGDGMFYNSYVNEGGTGAIHLYGQDSPRRGAYASAPFGNPLDIWALPPAGNVVDDDKLIWMGLAWLTAEQHNGRMRLDASIATTCNLRVEAVPIAFNLNINTVSDQLYPYTGVKPYDTRAVAALGGLATMYFQDDPYPSRTVSITWEYSPDIVNWKKLPVPAQYIRRFTDSRFIDYVIEIPLRQTSCRFRIHADDPRRSDTTCQEINTPQSFKNRL